MEKTLFPCWSSPPHKLSLKEGEVHLWRVLLDLPVAEMENLSGLLSDDERARAKRLLDGEKAKAFIAARGRLRQILASYLKLSPEEVSFAYKPHGKPYLEKDKDIRFNLSHSGCWALLAVTDGLKTGVDLERIDKAIDYEKIAARFFSPAERTLLAKFPEPRRRRGFYRLWTKKEASLKCLGSGFTLPEEAEDALSKRPLWCITFPLAKGYVGSLAVEGDVDLLHKWELV